jgi:hypothetical protein
VVQAVSGLMGHTELLRPSSNARVYDMGKPERLTTCQGSGKRRWIGTRGRVGLPNGDMAHSGILTRARWEVEQPSLDVVQVAQDIR